MDDPGAATTAGNDCCRRQGTPSLDYSYTVTALPQTLLEQCLRQGHFPPGSSCSHKGLYDLGGLNPVNKAG